MADSSIAVLDGTGATRQVDAQTVGTDFQQTVTIGDGANAGRVAAVTADRSLQTINNVATTSALTNVASSITSVTIVAANANRRGTIIFNDSTAVLSITYGSGATSSTSLTTKIQPAATYFLDVPLWTGAITGIWAAANGFARVTDISA